MSDQFANMSSIDIRRHMAELGWSSEDRVTNQGWGGGGKYGYSIWFERYDWHGKRTLVLRGSKACYHAYTGNLDHIDAAVSVAAELALRAWNEFPDCFPSQGVGGELIPREPIVVKDAT